MSPRDPQVHSPRVAAEAGSSSTPKGPIQWALRPLDLHRGTTTKGPQRLKRLQRSASAFSAL
eukprot:13207603-Alexandrium_andersonii.AAC.1